MATKERTVGVVCPRCATTQPVPVTAVAHECARCNWEWRFAICGTCDILACCLEYLESWRCESCNTFNRSWWKTADAEREAPLVAERRRLDNATHPGRRLAVVGLIVAFVLGSIWYVIPRQSMLIQLPMAVTKTSSNADKVNQFIRFVKGPVAQDLFAQNGFRPVLKSVAQNYTSKYPARPGIFKVDDKIIGGWRHADDVWFDPNKGRMVAIERAVGGPSSG